MSDVLKAVSLLVILCGLLASPAQTSRAADFSEGTASVNAYFSNKALYTNLDFMMPLFESPNNAAFFINPGGGINLRLKDNSRHTERVYFGIGQRLFLPGSQFKGGPADALLGKGLIFGFNWFIDWQYSMYSHFMADTGGGVELLSDLVDLRLNTYFKLTDAKKLDHGPSPGGLYGTALYVDRGGIYETLLNGVDGEVGFRLPIVDQIGEIRVFGGGFYHDAREVRRIRGIKGRIQWNPLPSIHIGAALFSNRHLNGEKWQLQFGFKLPFSANALSAGGSPFSIDNTPKTGNLWKDRFTTPIPRYGM